MIGETKKSIGVLLVLIVATALVIPGAMTLADESASRVLETSHDYYLISFPQLPAESVKTELSAAFGLTFTEYHQDSTFMARVPSVLAAKLAAHSAVSGLTQYLPFDKISPELKGAEGITALRVNLHDGEDVDATAEAISSLGVTVTRKNFELTNYIECLADAKDIQAISSIRAVNSVQPDGERQTHMNFISSNTYLGIDTPQANAFRGSGMLAEVQDNGCDRTHPDLTGVDYTDGSVVADSHGTCTTGIVFGTGAGSATAQGIAYEAIGAFADWETGRTTSVTNLWNGDFNEGMAGRNGVVQSNSWSQGGLDGTYTTYSNEDDVVAYNFPKVLTLWAAGNSNSGTGVGLITQDSANKNGMCIGAIFHKNTASMADDDYHDAGSGMTPSRGPAADGRMKPDMLAAFDWIYTVDQVGAAGYTSTNYYDDFGGTSGATPTVAGCAIQAYEMYQENYFDNNPTNAIPYSATIKALMIADAYQYPIGTNAITRNVEGWGAPDMENMYTLGPDYHVINERPQALSSGNIWSRNVYSDGTKPLKITIAWTDPAAPSTTGSGRALINNLDLKVTSPTGTVYWGNNGLWSNIWSVSGTGTNDWTRTNPAYTDDENNVENVFVQSPAAGIWSVEVQGATGDVAQGPQHFSMVASGAQGISGVGVISLDQSQYQLPDTIEVTVQDLDLNINPAAINTVNINIASTLEPAGETLTLTETGVDTSTFVNTISLSTTNSVGVLWGAHGNTITARYNDADAGGAGPATVTDTAIVDAQVLQVSGLTVEWFGSTDVTWINEGFTTGVPPTGWQVSSTGTTGTWSSQATTNAGGTSPEARFMYGSSGTGTSRLYCGPFDTTGLTQLNLQFRTMYDAYGTGVTVKVQTSTNAVTWTDTGWALIDRTTNLAATLITETISTAEGAGSSTFYVAWVVDRNSYQLDYWYVDNVLMTSTGGSVTANNWLNWTKSGDDGAGANDVVQYNIHRSSNSAGPWDASTIVQTVAPGTATWTDVARGEPDGINWWYVVRAVDDVGNIDTNTNAVPELPTGNLAPNAPTNPSPAHLAIGVSLNPTLSVSVSDPNGDTMDVRFYNAAGPTLIGTHNNVASGATASVSWNGRTSDTTYSWYAVADDGALTTQSSTWSFTTLDTTPPAPPTGLTVEWWGVTPATETLTTSGTTAAGGPHDVWFCDVDDATGAELTTPNSATEFTDAYYTNAATSNDIRAGPSADPGNTDEIFVKCRFATTATSATITGLEFTYEGQYSAGVTGTLYAWNAVGSTWDAVGTTQAFTAATDGTMTRTVAANPGNYISGGTIMWGVYASTRATCSVDYLEVSVDYNAPSVLNDNTLNWTASTSPDVAFYNIYRAAAEAGPWTTLIDTVPAGTTTYLDAGRGQSDGITWWYVVRAEDTSSNEEANILAVPEPAAPASYEINLAGKSANSWVFVSFPSGLTGTIQTILTDAGADGDGLTTWTVAKWYNPQDSADHWKSYRVGGTANDMPAMTNAMGVWLWITANGGDQMLTLNSPAAIPASTVINLYAGWNLVGYPSTTDRSGTTTPGLVDMISVYSGSAAYTDYMFAQKNLVTLHHGNAYFMHAASDTTWTVTNP